MSTLVSIVNRARIEMGDTPRPFQSSVLGDSVTRRFEVPYELIDPTPENLTLYLRLLTDPHNLDDIDPSVYELNDRFGIITFEDTDIPQEGEEVVVIGQHFQLFAQSDLLIWAQTSYDLHAATVTGPFSMADMTSVEELVVALYTAMEALWSMVTNSSFDIDITTPEGVLIPRSQRYRQMLEQLQLLEDRYDDLSQETGFGLGRVRMYNLRRVSYRTGRYVPLYIPQEFDDQATPQRIYPPIDSGV